MGDPIMELVQQDMWPWNAETQRYVPAHSRSDGRLEQHVPESCQGSAAHPRMQRQRMPKACQMGDGPMGSGE